ncbi:MAG TPA: 4Fe-4S dicluster domain-containing protein [Deferrisomatales bacterium]|nr:4Fe-4S dicluster domain-containing protein [Deferrisomatales bacterium]
MAKAFLTDTTRCIGCRGCQVACKEWNGLPAEPNTFWGTYENPRELTASSWRKVKFVEPDRGPVRWSFFSDSCKHCTQASCLTVCPTGAIYRTEWGAVVVNDGRCNGCRYCVAACPFKVVDFDVARGRVAKCTFCHDRVAQGLSPACAEVCPTGAIQFGERPEMLSKAQTRLGDLWDAGTTQARLYGETELAGLHNLSILTESPEAYGLPREPRHCVSTVFPGSLWSVGAAAAVGLAALIAFRERTAEEG